MFTMTVPTLLHKRAFSRGRQGRKRGEEKRKEENEQRKKQFFGPLKSSEVSYP